MKIKTINTLSFYILPVLLPLTGHAATITCDTTLYFCSIRGDSEGVSGNIGIRWQF